MYDDLDRIESTYGSVAEYYRSMNEERPKRYEIPYDDMPSDAHSPCYDDNSGEDKLKMYERRCLLYDKQTDYLNGTPSSLALSLKEKYKNWYPDEKNYETPAVYSLACETAYIRMLLDCAKQLDFKYGVHLALDGPCYMKVPNTFGISVDFHDRGRIFHLAVAELDLATFKELFRDLDALDFNPNMHYVDQNMKKHVYCHGSLGMLRHDDFPQLGIESKEAIEKELKEAGLDVKSNADYLALKSDTPAFEKLARKQAKVAFGR